jgi:hypothetical protein
LKTASRGGVELVAKHGETTNGDTKVTNFSKFGSNWASSTSSFFLSIFQNLTLKIESTLTCFLTSYQLFEFGSQF